MPHSTIEKKNNILRWPQPTMTDLGIEIYDSETLVLVTRRQLVTSRPQLASQRLATNHEQLILSNQRQNEPSSKGLVPLR